MLSSCVSQRADTHNLCLSGVANGRLTRSIASARLLSMLSFDDFTCVHPTCYNPFAVFARRPEATLSNSVCDKYRCRRRHAALLVCLPEAARPGPMCPTRHLQMKVQLHSQVGLHHDKP